MKKFLSFLLACTLLLCLALPANAAGKIPHGTATAWITEDMLSNTPPADYHINSATQADAKEKKYNAFFLKDDLQTVEITIDENNLNYLLQNAKNEPYVMTTSVTIGGTTLGYCGLRTKGNYTLQHSYDNNPNSDRFSFTVNFGKYITKAAYGEKQNFYGCEKISFNNFFFDKSMLKEYFSFKLMEEMGLPTPQHGLAKLYINGQYYGVYFMVEAMDETVLEQYWNLDGKDLSSYLCKPTGTTLRHDELVNNASGLYEWDEETYAETSDMISTVMSWSKKLTQLSDGTDFDGKPINVNSDEYVQLLEKVLDLDEVIRYFAVCSWLCQLDNMFTNLQNYGLYVSQEGVATVLPWDYDLAFGCYYPSSAQNTANYPVDVMYRLDLNWAQNEAIVSANTYKNFPLFHVIYQNDALMEKYHQYMLECSQIAALGGTLESTGKSYDPGYFHSCLETLEEPLLAAATEKTADNVYYMNHIRQPQDVKAALPNLSAIIAQRAVGVWTQIKGMDTTVSAAGCNLETLGNAIVGDYANEGILTTVDAATGIFATAEYRGGHRVSAPSLTVQTLTTDNADYQQIAAALEVKKSDLLLVYKLSSRVKAASDYTITIPVSPDHLKEETSLHFYTFANVTLEEWAPTQDGNLFTGKTEKLGTIVVLIQPPAPSTLTLIISIAAIVGGGAATAMSIIGIRAHRRKKNQNT